MSRDGCHKFSTVSNGELEVKYPFAASRRTLMKLNNVVGFYTFNGHL